MCVVFFSPCFSCSEGSVYCFCTTWLQTAPLNRLKYRYMIIVSKLYGVEGLLRSMPARNLSNMLAVYGTVARFRVGFHSLGQNMHRVLRNKHQMPRYKRKWMDGWRDG